MNILVIGKFYTEGFALHIVETLSTMGHAVRRFEPGFKPNRIGGRIGHRLDQVRGVIHSASDRIPEIRARRMRALWQVTEQGPLDVVIVCHDFLWPDEVAELKRRTGSKVAMWFPDHLANFGKGFFMNALYDELFFKDPYIVGMLSGVLSSPVYYLPECFNPERHCLSEVEVPDDEYRCDITTAGNQHFWRVALYNIWKTITLSCGGRPRRYGCPNGPVAQMYQGRLVLNEDKARAFLGAKIVLNNQHYGEIWGLNVRTFEAAGIGAFQMVDWQPGLNQLFDIGKEIISFSGIDDMKSKIDYFLAHNDERDEIAEAGKRRAHAEHTYKHRLQLLFDTLSGYKNGYPCPNIELVKEEC